MKYTDCGAPNSANAVQVNLRSTGHGGVPHNGYDPNEVDAIVVYLPPVDALCWFGPEAFEGRTALTVRLAPPLNGQQKGIRCYEDYRW